ncbi:MAG TPA: PKD domain-containing protein [Ktedonobacterales bacterium]
MAQAQSDGENGHRIFAVQRPHFQWVSAAVGAVLLVACVVSALFPQLSAIAPNARATATSEPVDFSATPTSGAAPLTVRFVGPAANGITSVKWDFGDGAGAGERDPKHTYTVAGEYSVTLEIGFPSGVRTVHKVGYISVGLPASSWITVLDDQFNRPGLPSHWSVYVGSFKDGAHNCAAASLVQVPGDGYLHLKMAYLYRESCGTGWYTSGIEVASQYGGVDQAVTVRFRIVPPRDSDVVRSQRALPMRWVEDPRYQWYQGESDYCEGSWLDRCYTFLHYRSSDSDPFQVERDYTLDLTQWHTWRVETIGHKVTVYIDDMTRPAWVYDGPAYTTPLSIKRTVLQHECPLYGCPPASYAGEVLDVQVDWITIQNYRP